MLLYQTYVKIVLNHVHCLTSTDLVLEMILTLFYTLKWTYLLLCYLVRFCRRE